MVKNYGRSLLIRIAVIALSFIGILVGISLFSSRMNSKNALITEARMLSQQNNKSSETLARFKSDDQKARLILARMDPLLPNQYELFRFSSWAERAGRTQGVQVAASAQNNTLFRISDVIGYAPIGITVTGKPDDAFSYLKFIEGANGQYVIILDSVDVNATQNASGTITLTAPGKILFKQQ